MTSRISVARLHKLKSIIQKQLSVCMLVAIALSVVTAQTASAQVMSPEGKLLVSEGRLSGLASAVGSRALVDLTLERITGIKGNGPGVWAYEIRKLGEYFEKAGDAALEQHDKTSALKNYKSALGAYGKAYMPGNYTAAERKAYSRFRDVALKMNQFLAYPFKVVKIPFQGKEIITHLYLPKGVKKPALVLYTGGTDGSKEMGYGTGQALAAKGYAVVSFDLAGTGESMGWHARPSSHDHHKRILDYFEETGDYDFSRIGLIGGSFGGYYAIRMAAEDKRVKAAINHCGLVDSAFRVPMAAMPHVLQSMPGAMIYSAMRRMGFDPEKIIEGGLSDAETAKFAKVANSFSLVTQGVVGAGSATFDTPLLIVNGTRDPVVSMADIKLVEDAANNSETWLMGQASHCAPNYMYAASSDMFNWLDEKLNTDTVSK